MKKTVGKVVLLLIYSYILARLLIIREDSLITQTSQMNTHLFSTISSYYNGMRAGSVSFYDFFVNIIANVLIFVPFGILLLSLSLGIKASGVLVLGGLVTFSIEVFQLISGVGVFDIDDIFLNFLGVVLGVLIFFWFEWMKEKSDGS